MVNTDHSSVSEIDSDNTYGCANCGTVKTRNERMSSRPIHCLDCEWVAKWVVESDYYRVEEDNGELVVHHHPEGLAHGE